MDDIEKLMLIKLDLLGLRTLDVLSDWRRQMRERHGMEIDWSQLEWEYNDPEMWELLADGSAAGVFQLEKGYPKQLAKEIRPRSVEDLSVIVALNRPGPIRSGAAESYVLRRKGGEDDKFDGRKIPLAEAEPSRRNLRLVPVSGAGHPLLP
jgi:DNA polymerase-3 subunit alpha